MNKQRWICCQIGVREHYLVPRSLQRLNQDVTLLTDMWIKPNSMISKLYSKSRSRYHNELNKIDIHHFNNAFLLRRFFRPSQTNWDVLFDTLASRQLEKIATTASRVFTNSYASLETLRAARSLGLYTVYQQINGGPAEADIVKKVYKDEFGDKYKPTVPSDAYWDRWTQEISFPDDIIVNSEWSKQLLTKAGVDENRITVVPFAYQGVLKTLEHKSYPSSFSVKRPLRILYLGTLSLRKGFHVLKQAMAELIHEPVVLDVVGRLNGPQELMTNMPVNVHYHGQVSSFETDRFYRNSDVFILPTFSDGFALTQMEAFSYKLPLIVTPFCGRVAEHFKTGYVLKQVTVAEIKESIRYFIENPHLVQKFSENIPSVTTDALEQYGAGVLALAGDAHHKHVME